MHRDRYRGREMVFGRRDGLRAVQCAAVNSVSIA